LYALSFVLWGLAKSAGASALPRATRFDSFHIVLKETCAGERLGHVRDAIRLIDTASRHFMFVFPLRTTAKFTSPFGFRCSSFFCRSCFCMSWRADLFLFDFAPRPPFGMNSFCMPDLYIFLHVLHVVECRSYQQYVCSLFRELMRFINLGVEMG